ncbi:MAG: hypothetical protein NXI10_11060 [bacterium]|nr:hypothetical protein [bacterium]
MTKWNVLLIFLSISLVSIGQGLNCELGFNNQYDQFTSDVAVNEEFSYVSITDWGTNVFGQSSFVSKIDTNGNVLWEEPIEPYPAEVTKVINLKASNENGVYVFGNGREICDVGNLCFWYLQKYDANGNNISRVFSNWECWAEFSSELTVTQNNELLLTLDSTSDISTLYHLDSALNVLQSMTLATDSIVEVDMFNNGDFLAIKKDSLLLLDNTGSPLIGQALASEPIDIQVYNDTLYLLTEDSIFQMDASLQSLQSSAVTGYTNYTNLKVDGNRVQFTSVGWNQVSVLSTSHDLQLIEVLTIPIDESLNQVMDHNDVHLVAAQSYNLASFQSVRYRNFSLLSTSSSNVNNSDVGIVDFSPSYIEAVDDQGAPGYLLKIEGSALVKNFGTVPVNHVRINHYMGLNISCGYTVYSEPYSGITIPPGDSLWIDLGMVHNFFAFLPGDTLVFEMCLYSSHANELTDLNVSNDEFCKDLIIGYVGIEEVETNPGVKEIVKMFDLLGKEVEHPQNQMVIILYSDGTTDKIYISE